MELLIAFLMGTLNALSPWGTSLDQHQHEEWASKVEWTCQNPEWVGRPGMVNGNFKGTIQSRCQFTAVKGTGYPTLQDYMIRKISQAPEVKKIHAGPIDETYSGMPSIYYDVTIGVASGNDWVDVRQDAHLASDMQSRMLLDSISKSTHGEGYGKYLKKFDVFVDLNSTKTSGQYSVLFKSGTIVEKPWYAPTDMFINEVKNGMVNKMVELRKELVIEMANNM